MSDLIDDALREMLDRRLHHKTSGQGAVEMPVSHVNGQGLQPGLDLTDTSGLIDALDGFAPMGGPNSAR